MSACTWRPRARHICVYVALACTWRLRVRKRLRAQLPRAARFLVFYACCYANHYLHSWVNFSFSFFFSLKRRLELWENQISYVLIEVLLYFQDLELVLSFLTETLKSILVFMKDLYKRIISKNTAFYRE